jgi:nitrite reductase/ring-hydroxylating ferredoxin subunit
MSEEKAKLSGPDLTQGVELATIPDGTMLLGHAQGEPVLLARRGDEVFAIGAICTHYSAPLEQGLLDGDTVRCQWHHACFSLRTGEALRAPALNPVSHWRVEHWHREEVRDVARQFTPVETPVGSVYVQEKFGGHRLCSREAGERKSASTTADSWDPRVHRYRRRWCGGQCSRRDAPPGRLLRPHHDAERG